MMEMILLYNLMIEKALDKDGKRLFQDGHKASLRREVNATILQDIQIAMMTSGDELRRLKRLKPI